MPMTDAAGLPVTLEDGAVMFADLHDLLSLHGAERDAEDGFTARRRAAIARLRRAGIAAE